MSPENDTQNTKESFYRAFEDRFRGTRDAIKARLRVYLPFIEPLKEVYDVCNAVDLGCGRGEWLELLTESGVIAHGVDLDNGMLAACRERGLSVETADAIAYLKSLPDESQVLVSGFHIVEHIHHNDVKTLIQEALRVLKPAGLLILETPNPENITVGTLSFYLDPTHLNPIPPRLLAFISEYYGFHKIKILRLQEAPDLRGGKSVNLADVITGVSPDYAIVAQKRAESNLLEGFDLSFASEYGISLDAMLARYSAKEEILAHRLDAIEVETRTEISALRTEINNIYYSRSWQITQPLRWFSLQIKLLRKDGLYVRLKAVFRRLFLRSNRRPSSSQSREASQKGDSPGHDKGSSNGQLSQQTKRDVPPERSSGMGGGFRKVMRLGLISTTKLVSDYARRMPKLRRLAFRILHKFPNLELKLRGYNQESQSKSQLMVIDWHTTAVDSQVQPGDVPYAGKGLTERNSSLKSMHTFQRTPLETNYHKYRKSA